MANGLTGSMVIANLGLLKNSGLAINQSLQQTVNTFNSSNISGSVQTVLETASPEIIEVLQDAPVCFTGFLPESMQGTTGFIKTNVPKSIINQAATLFQAPDGSDSVAAFIHIFTLANGYCTQIDGIQRAAMSAQGKSFGAFGAQFGNYSDIVSGGITGQFKASALPALAAELPNLGKMSNTKVLAEIANPGALVNQLYSLGLGNIGNLRNMIEENGITLDFANDTEKSLLLKIFKKITGDDLATIMNVTSFNPHRLYEVQSLADVLDVNKIFSSAALEAIGNPATLDMLANKLSNIGGRFSSMGEIGTFLSSINITSFPALSLLKTMIPDELIDDLRTSFGKGLGPSGNPMITDLIGCASGIRYTDKIASIIATQQRLLSTDVDVQNFKNYLDAGIIDALELQTLIDKITTKITLVDVLNESNRLLINCASQLLTEKTNLRLAKIVTGTVEANVQDIQNFVNTLSKLPPTDNLNLGEFLTNVVTSDVYGDALKATIVEGQNLTRMAAYSINIGTRLS